MSTPDPQPGDEAAGSSRRRNLIILAVCVLLGGVIWGTGMVFNLVAANFTGVAISYAIGQSAPMVAALWGVLAWNEFAGAGSRAKLYLGLMFVFYCFAILLVAGANG